MIRLDDILDDLDFTDLQDITAKMDFSEIDRIIENLDFTDFEIESFDFEIDPIDFSFADTQKDGTEGKNHNDTI